MPPALRCVSATAPVLKPSRRPSEAPLMCWSYRSTSLVLRASPLGISSDNRASSETADRACQCVTYKPIWATAASSAREAGPSRTTDRARGSRESGHAVPSDQRHVRMCGGLRRVGGRQVPGADEGGSSGSVDAEVDEPADAGQRLYPPLGDSSVGPGRTEADRQGLVAGASASSNSDRTRPGAARCGSGCGSGRRRRSVTKTVRAEPAAERRACSGCCRRVRRWCCRGC